MSQYQFLTRNKPNGILVLTMEALERIMKMLKHYLDTKNDGDRRLLETIRKSPNGMVELLDGDERIGIVLDNEMYKSVNEAYEDAVDYAMAVERMATTDMSKTISHEQLMKELGITREALDAMDEVEFE